MGSVLKKFLSEVRKVDKGSVEDMSMTQDKFDITFEKGHVLRMSEEGLSFIHPPTIEECDYDGLIGKLAYKTSGIYSDLVGTIEKSDVTPYKIVFESGGSVGFSKDDQIMLVEDGIHVNQ